MLRQELTFTTVSLKYSSADISFSLTGMYLYLFVVDRFLNNNQWRRHYSPNELQCKLYLHRIE